MIEFGLQGSIKAEATRMESLLKQGIGWER